MNYPIKPDLSMYKPTLKQMMAIVYHAVCDSVIHGKSFFYEIRKAVVNHFNRMLIEFHGESLREKNATIMVVGNFIIHFQKPGKLQSKIRVESDCSPKKLDEFFSQILKIHGGGNQ